MRIRIIIDDQDAADAPESPFTLNVYRDDDGGTQSRIPLGDEAVIGADVPAMLRDLAARWEADPSGYEHPASEYERPADEPEPGPCANCGKRIEPDDGGAIWYHADTGARFCDGDDDRSRSWAECADVAEPLDAPDQASSASRQHYIDTGRYLTHREVREEARAETKEV